VSAVYPSAKDALLRGQLDLLVDTLKVRMLGDYVYDPADVFHSDLTNVIGSAVQVTVASVADGLAIANDITFPNVVSGTTVKGLAVYRDAVTPESSPLIAYLDRRADSTLLGVIPNGADITFTFTNYLIRL
jgi:hypothetical protein